MFLREYGPPGRKFPRSVMPMTPDTVHKFYVVSRGGPWAKCSCRSSNACPALRYIEPHGNWPWLLSYSLIVDSSTLIADTVFLSSA